MSKKSVNMKPVIIPFGKYKGQPLEVLENDTIEYDFPPKID